ncbi:hypothetical protein SVAN01_02716 [Stagonosporopsis vannaccii]|nr:hypothetical protein SVAN01_02716 [Stagonosporopsis vannaccii]
MQSRPNPDRTGPPYHVFRAWAFEIATVILAAGLIVAIAVLLASYDGIPTPDWGVHINLNALLALLSTILRAALVVLVAQVISQRKWDWFAGSAHPISDLQRYDSGSRGSLGALRLLHTVLFKDAIALVAACILVVSFLVGPFVQLASRTAECSFPVPGLDASLPYAHFIPRKPGFQDGSLYGEPTRDLLVTILSSAMAPTGVENQIAPACATGNCTFFGSEVDNNTPALRDREVGSPLSTVAMCSKCVDATSLITRRVLNSTSSNNFTYTEDLRILPSGLNISAGATNLFVITKMETTEELDWLGDSFDSDLRVWSRWAYANVTYLGLGDNDTMTASVCTLYPCMRTYLTSVTNNQLSEELIHSEPLLPDMADEFNDDDLPSESMADQPPSFSNLVAVQAPCEGASDQGATRLALYNTTDHSETQRSSITYTNMTSSETCIYRHDAMLASTIARVLRAEVFTGTCSTYKTLACSRSSTLTLRGGNTLGNMAVDAVMRALYNDGDMTFARINNWFASFADAMTNKFRAEYGAMGRQGITASNSGIGTEALPLDTVRGLAWQTKTCVAMHWQWLLLPILLTFVTAILAVWTIAATWRKRGYQPVWKDSLLPLLFYGDRIEPADEKGLLGPMAWQKQNSSDDAQAKANEDKYPLLEGEELLKRARGIRVTTRWQAHAARSEEAAMLAHKAGSTSTASMDRQRDMHPTESDGLMGRDDGAHVAGPNPAGPPTESDGFMGRNDFTSFREGR